MIRAPGTITCTVSLDRESPGAGVELVVSIDNETLATPERLVVPAGSSSVTFVVDGTSIQARGTANLRAATATSSRMVELWLLPQGDLSPVLYSVVNGASLLPGPVAPGEVVAAFGSELSLASAPLTDGPENDPSGEGTGVAALFDNVPAPLLSVQPRQVNAMVPYSLAGRADVRLEIEVAGRRSNPLSLAVMKTAPGVFTADASGKGQAIAVNEDGTANSLSRPARRGSVIGFYAAGLGETEPEPELQPGDVPLRVKAQLLASIDGVEADVVDACMAPGPVIGLYLVTAFVPIRASAGDALPLLLTAGGVASQAGVTVAIQ